jgi:pilus assembly protein Flp/PilA
MKSLIARLWREEEGQDLTEYALVLVLIALTTIAAMDKLANGLKTTFSTAAANLHTS